MSTEGSINYVTLGEGFNGMVATGKNHGSGLHSSRSSANLLKEMMVFSFFQRLKSSKLFNTTRLASMKKISTILFLNLLQKKIKTYI